MSFAAKPPEGTTWHAPPLAGQDFLPQQPVYQAPSPSPAICPEPGTVKNFTLIRHFTLNYTKLTISRYLIKDIA